VIAGIRILEQFLTTRHNRPIAAPFLRVLVLCAALIITRLVIMNGGRIIAGCKRLHTKDLIKNKKKKKKMGKAIYLNFM
jgi:hypothetical protein